MFLSQQFQTDLSHKPFNSSFACVRTNRFQNLTMLIGWDSEGVRSSSSSLSILVSHFGFYLRVFELQNPLENSSSTSSHSIIIVNVNNNVLMLQNKNLKLIVADYLIAVFASRFIPSIHSSILFIKILVDLRVTMITFCIINMIISILGNTAVTITVLRSDRL